MSDLVPYEPEDYRTYEQQIKDALLKALEIQGTVLSDLEAAINCIIQMERPLHMFGIPNPHEATAVYLKKKYKMERQKAQDLESQVKRLTSGPDLHPIEVVEPKVELVESTDDIVDGEIVE